VTRAAGEGENVPSRFAGRKDVVDRLVNLHRRGDLGQSYLFLGPEGSGKELTALEVARLINCPTPDVCRETPSCESCRKAITFQHPDIRWIGPAPASVGDAEATRLFAAKQEDPFHQPAWAASSEVLIGDPDRPSPLTVRSVLQFLRLKPFQGTTKVAVVADAHRLRSGAANAFLKVLEEPPADALILLLSSVRASVLPTIQSRCQRIPFGPYAEDELTALLGDAYGLDAAEAAALARRGGGNARRAARLRLPVSRVLDAWGRELITAVHAGRAGSAMLAAEALHKGVLPAGIVEGINEAGGVGTPLRNSPVKELAEKRERAILLCEILHLIYSEILGCRVRGDQWRPAQPADAAPIAALAAERSPESLLRDIESLEGVRRDIERNLNIGLVTAVLFQELSRHAREDRTSFV